VATAGGTGGRGRNRSAVQTEVGGGPEPVRRRGARSLLFLNLTGGKLHPDWRGACSEPTHREVNGGLLRTMPCNERWKSLPQAALGQRRDWCAGGRSRTHAEGLHQIKHHPSLHCFVRKRLKGARQQARRVREATPTGQAAVVGFGARSASDDGASSS